jgi:hypothetical protein
MATGAQATEKVAKATGVSVTYVERAARILKEADADLWPKAKKGGGKGAAHVMPAHLVNLLLALMAADPITEAPEIVPRCRAMMPDLKNDLASDEFETGQENHIAAILDDFCPGANLGEKFEGLVRTLMEIDNRARARQLLGNFEVGRSFQSGGTISATAEISGTVIGFVEPIGGLLSLMQGLPEGWEQPGAAIADTKSVPFRIFETLADLALDTERALGRAVAPEGAEDTSKAAAEDADTTTPATGRTGPAPVETASQPGGNPVNPADRNNQQDRSMREREQSSSSSAALTGSPSSDPTDQTKGGHHGQAEDFRHAAQPEHQVRR